MMVSAPPFGAPRSLYPVISALKSDRAYHSEHRHGAWTSVLVGSEADLETP